MRKKINLSEHPKRKFILLNILAAVVILFIIGFFILLQLDNYTRHNEYISVPSFQKLTANEAGALAKEHKLRITIVDSIYQDESEPGTIIEQNPRNGAKVKANRMIHLTINAMSPEMITFPDLQNTAFRQTLQSLESRGFQIGHIEYAPSEFKNLVLNFTYKGKAIIPGSSLEKGSVINIILGDGDSGSNTVFVPDISNRTVKEATRLLQHSYLNTGQVIPDNTIQTAADRQTAIVYRQDPAAGNEISAGNQVALYITLNKERVKKLDSLLIRE